MLQSSGDILYICGSHLILDLKISHLIHYILDLNTPALIPPIHPISPSRMIFQDTKAPSYHVTSLTQKFFWIPLYHYPNIKPQFLCLAFKTSTPPPYYLSSLISDVNTSHLLDLGMSGETPTLMSRPFCSPPPCTLSTAFDARWHIHSSPLLYPSVRPLVLLRAPQAWAPSHLLFWPCQTWYAAGTQSVGVLGWECWLIPWNPSWLMSPMLATEKPKAE